MLPAVSCRGNKICHSRGSGNPAFSLWPPAHSTHSTAIPPSLKLRKAGRAGFAQEVCRRKWTDNVIAKEPQATVAISNLAIRKPFIFLRAPHRILRKNVKEKRPIPSLRRSEATAAISTPGL